MPSRFTYVGNSVAYANVVEALLDAPYTIDELAKLSGLARTTTWKFVHALRRRSLAYVGVWRTDTQGRYTRPAYSLGNRPDALRPSPKTPTQRSAAMRKRKALLAMTREYDEASSVAPC